MWRPTPNDPAEFFSQDELESSRRYQRPLTRLRIARLAISLLLAVALVAFEAAPRLIEWAGVSNWVAQLVVVLLALEVVAGVIELPFDAYVELGHDRRWGLSTQTARGFVADLVKGFLLSTVMALLLLVPIYALIRSTSLWWLWGWIVVVALTVLFGFLFPMVIAPIFNRFDPLDDEELAGRVRRIAALAEVPIEGVFVADESRRSRRDNAYVAGLGRSRRVVLYDTILEHPPELLEQVVAHELGHWRRHHLRAQIPLVAALTLVLFLLLRLLSDWGGLWDWAGLEGIGDPAGLPLLLVVAQVAGTVTSLVTSWVSRAHEREADLEALELLGQPDAVVEMLRRLHVKNLADLQPSRLRQWTASHPPAAERMAFARRWEEAEAATGNAM